MAIWAGKRLELVVKAVQKHIRGNAGFPGSRNPAWTLRLHILCPSPGRPVAAIFQHRRAPLTPLCSLSISSLLLQGPWVLPPPPHSRCVPAAPDRPSAWRVQSDTFQRQAASFLMTHQLRWEVCVTDSVCREPPLLRLVKARSRIWTLAICCFALF